jgi:hypothetical protein
MSESSSSSLECIVCLEAMESSTLPCQHNVHTRCIALSGQNKCSVCRRDIVFTDEQDQQIFAEKVREMEQENERQNARASETLARYLANQVPANSRERFRMVINQAFGNVAEGRIEFDDVNDDDDDEDDNEAQNDDNEPNNQMIEREIVARIPRRDHPANFLARPSALFEPFRVRRLMRDVPTSNIECTVDINDEPFNIILQNVDNMGQTLGGVLDFGDMIQMLNQICINVNSSQRQFSSDVRALQLYRIMCMMNHLSAQSNLSVVELCNIISSLQ